MFKKSDIEIMVEATREQQFEFIEQNNLLEEICWHDVCWAEHTWVSTNMFSVDEDYWLVISFYLRNDDNPHQLKNLTEFILEKR